MTGNFQTAFDRLRAECPHDLRSQPSAWIGWMREKGREDRLHGGVLDAAIMDSITDPRPVAQPVEIPSGAMVPLADVIRLIAARIHDDGTIDEGPAETAELMRSIQLLGKTVVEARTPEPED